MSSNVAWLIKFKLTSVTLIKESWNQATMSVMADMIPTLNSSLENLNGISKQRAV